MLTNSITNLFGQNSQSQTVQNKTLGKNDFLKLMIAQMKNQNPLNPMDSKDFTSQLAQFSSLEQLQNMNASLTKSINANFQLTQAVNNTMTATLIGKEVKLNGDEIQYNGQKSFSFGYNLQGDAKNVTVNIYNENGGLVKTFENVPNNKGEHKLSWDFTDNNGEKIPNGNYTVKVDAKAPNGSDIKADTYLTGIIDAIKFTDKGTKLLINNVGYDLSDVLEILNTTNSNN